MEMAKNFFSSHDHEDFFGKEEFTVRNFRNFKFIIFFYKTCIFYVGKT